MPAFMNSSGMSTPLIWKVHMLSAALSLISVTSKTSESSSTLETVFESVFICTQVGVTTTPASLFQTTSSLVPYSMGGKDYSVALTRF